MLQESSTIAKDEIHASFNIAIFQILFSIMQVQSILHQNHKRKNPSDISMPQITSLKCTEIEKRIAAIRQHINIWFAGQGPQLISGYKVIDIDFKVTIQT